MDTSRNQPKRAGAGRLKVVLGAQDSAIARGEFEQTLSLEEFATLARSGRIARHVGRYREVVAVAPNAHAIPRPFAVATCLRMMARRSAVIEGADGTRRPITWLSCVAAARQLQNDRREFPRVLAEVERRLAAIEAMPAPPPLQRRKPARTLCLRTDLWLGVKAGGAVAHTAGIVNALAKLGHDPVLAAFEPNPILRPDIRQHRLEIPRRFWDTPEGPAIAANIDVEGEVDRLIGEVRPDLVYHRLAAFSFAGALAAQRRGLPLIVEYNGSEVWIARNWGRPLRNESLAQRMEDAVLRAADRIIVVSEPLRAELISRGIDAGRVRTVMNGVDTDRIHPGLDGTAARRRYGIALEETVVGFIGSFGRWHGVPVLVEAFARLSARPEGARARLLLIGDGLERAEIEAHAKGLGLGGRVVFTGLVPQDEAPEILAAADILVAPQVPNADGSPFFGSPTKLFEYMSLGRCIVASRLDQMAEVLVDGETALLVEPGDAEALASGLAEVVANHVSRGCLADAARRVAVGLHDWRLRVQDILA